MRFFQGAGVVALTITSTLIGVAWATRGVDGLTIVVMLLCAAGAVGLANLPFGRPSPAPAERR